MDESEVSPRSSFTGFWGNGHVDGIETVILDGDVNRIIPIDPNIARFPSGIEYDLSAGAKPSSLRPRESRSMECDKCGRDAVMYAAYSGSHLCGEHFCDWVDSRVRRRIRTDGLVGDISPDDPETWVIGLSGGKDSVVLTYILSETFDQDPRIELVALSIHEGIEEYRDDSLDASVALTDELGIRHEVVTYEDEFGVAMDDVAVDDPFDMAPCAYCGVFRRDVLSRFAEEFDADLLLTGHNLDDEAETALMNVFEGDVDQIAKHFDASLGAMADRHDSAFIPRAKPLRDIPEKEVALYAHLTDLPVHIAECPHADRAFRGEIQSLLLDVEENHPGTRHSIMAGYETLAELAAADTRRDDPDVGACVRCGSPSRRDVCRKCTMLDAVTTE